MTAVDVDTVAQLAIPGLELTATSATFTGPLTPMQAETVLRRLDQHSSALNWWIGDITLAYWRCVQGGDDAMRAVEPPADQPNTARCVAVALAFPQERRRADVTWSHHFEVVSYPVDDQDRLLALAAAEAMSVRRFRDVLAAEKAARAPQLDVAVWQPVLPRPVDVKRILDAVGDAQGWVLWQPATGTVKSPT